MKTLSAFYDLALCPISFNFISWLVRARMQARDAGCKGLHVVIVPKEDGLGGFARHWGNHDEVDTRWRLWHILVPACVLAGATVTIACDKDQAHKLKNTTWADWWPDGKAYHVGPIIDAARKGVAIPKVRATDAARRYVKSWVSDRLITITVRNQTTDSARNSSQDWAAMRGFLLTQGYDVCVLYESNIALNFERGVWAELDIDLRMAVYERARMNVVGNNGPAELMWFSDAPYMMFNAALPANPYKAHWEKYQSLRTGDQVPCATANQRMIYRPDTLDIMKEEFTKWEAL